MLKFLLLAAFVLLVVGFLRQARTARSAHTPPPARAPERMVKCAYCGVNQPVSESILTHGKYYCSDAHRQQAAARDA